MIVPPAPLVEWWRTHRFGVSIVSVGLVGAWLLLTAWWEATESRLRDFLPEQIGVSKLVAEADDAGLVCYLIPLCREVCGGFAFRLTDATVANLRADGMRPLYKAKVSRGLKDSQTDNHLVDYNPWQPTPVPSSWTSEGLWSGLSCLKDRHLDRDAVARAAEAPGSYFTTSTRGSEVLVIPSLQLVVFTYGP